MLCRNEEQHSMIRKGIAFQIHLFFAKGKEDVKNCHWTISPRRKIWVLGSELHVLSCLPVEATEGVAERKA